MKRINFLLLISLMACGQPKMPQAPEQVPVEAADTILADTPPDTTKVVLPAKKYAALDYDTTSWTDISVIDSTIVLDLKYATADNFVKTPMYECPRCWLRPEVAKAVLKAHHIFQQMGYGGVKMFDCYRPRPIQWKLWEKVPDPRFVADPRKGSMHNRGAAVDMTIVDSTGQEIEMGTPFDYFGKKAYHNYRDLPDEVLAHRELLKSTMESLGFEPTSTEWWHYAYIRRNYPLSDVLWKCY